MKKNILILAMLVTVFGCTSQSLQKEEIEKVKTKTVLDSTALSTEATNHFVDGTIYDMKGQYAEAILEYQQSLELDPDPGIHFAIANDFLRLNKLAMALKHAEKAVEQDSNKIEYNELLAKIFLISHQPDSAQTIFEKIISLDSTDVNAYYNLGMLYEQKKPSQAIKVYEKLLDITGPEWSVLVKIADLNERMGNVEKTIETVENLLELNPSSLELKKILIESYIKTAKYDKAAALADETLTVFPDDLELIEMRANALIQGGKWEKGSGEYMRLIENKKFPFDAKLKIAGAFLTQAAKDSTYLPVTKEILMKINKDSVDWQVNSFLGEIALYEKNDSLAISYFQKAADLAAWNSKIWVRLGGLLFDNGKYAEAINQLTKAIKNFPDEFALNIILGLSLSQENNYKEAKPYLEKALKLKPNDFTALYAYGFTLNQLKDEDEAIVYLKKALKVDPDNVQIWGTLGMIYDNKKMWGKCDSAYEKALTIDSTDVLVLNNYAYSLAERGIELDRALRMSEKAVEKEPENSSYLDTKGWIHYKLGEYTEAAEYINKAINKDGENAVLFDHLGDVQFQMGDKDKAISLWKEALKLDSTQIKVKEKIEKGAL